MAKTTSSKTKSLVIEQGAVFCGACNMKEHTGDLGFLPPKDIKKAEVPKPVNMQEK